jgi:hypothetical protein
MHWTNSKLIVKVSCLIRIFTWLSEGKFVYIDHSINMHCNCNVKKENKHITFYYILSPPHIHFLGVWGGGGGVHCTFVQLTDTQ